MSVEKSPRVHVAIVSYNSSETLPRCLQGLEAQTYRDFSVTLIDNASVQKPGDLLSILSVPTSYLEMDENLGFAPAMTLALNATDSAFLVALNPDAFPNPDWLDALVAAADKHSDFAALGSVQMDASNPTKVDGFGDNILAWGPAWRGQDLPSGRADTHLYECFGVCAAAALYRTETLREIGGFDDRFFCFYEDVDVCFRLRLAGHRCGVATGAVVEHVGGASFEGKSDLADFLVARNQWWLLIKNMPAALLFAILPAYFLMQLYAFVRNPRSARMKGLSEGLSRTREILKSRHNIQTNRTISTLDLNQWLAWNPRSFRDRKSIAIRT